MAGVVTILTGYFVLTNIGMVHGFTVSGANSLHTALWAGYNNLVRPTELVNVEAEFILLSINGLVLKTQTFSTAGFFEFFWTDSRLTWTPSAYDNTSFIYATELKIWRPELVVDNSVSQISVIADDDLLFRVDYKGHVKWEPPGTFDTHCEVDITWFPFDQQTCFLELTSWAYTIDVVSLSHHLTHVDLADYQVNGEWDILSTSLDRQELVADGERYSQLEFIIKMSRRPSYYFMNMIFPVILISFLTTVVFILPVESGERISFSITILLALALLLTLISDIMPTTSIHISILAIYIMTALTLSTLSVLLTSLNLRLYHKDAQRQVPGWLKIFTKRILMTGLCPCRYQGRRSECKHDIIAEEEKDVKDSEKKVVTAWADTDKDNKNSDEEFNLTLKDISVLMDIFFFRLFITMTIGCTFLFLLVLGIGATIYIMTALTLSTLSVLLTSLNLRLYHKDEQRQVPRWLKIFTRRILMTGLCPCRYQGRRSEFKHDIITEEEKDVKDSEKKVVTAWADTDKDSKNSDEELNLTLKDISVLMDIFFIRLFITMTIGCTFLFLLVLRIGASVSTSGH